MLPWVPVLGLLLALAAAPTAMAQRGACFPDEPVPLWVAGDLALDAPGASRPLPPEVDGEYELCSDGTGFAADSDHYRYLVRRAAGDFVFEGALLDILDQGMGGIAARWDERTADAAYVRIGVHARPGGGFELRSDARLDNGTLALEAAPPLPVALPVWLRIERTGSGFITAYSSDGIVFDPHLAIDAVDHDLDRGVVVVGMVQASESPGSFHSAVFGETGFVFPDVPRPDGVACADDLVIPVGGGSEVELRGLNLESVQGVELAGVPAEILSRSDRSLIVRAGALADRGPALLARDPQESASPVSGDVVIESAHGPLPLETRVVYAGVPFVRGDVTGDERVDVRDLLKLWLALSGRAGVSCLEAADVNADHGLDGGDLWALLWHLAGRGDPPPAPFPEPGFAPEGGRACGLPGPPVIEKVERPPVHEAQRRHRPGKHLLREGDEILLVGRGFPADPDRLVVRFGNVQTDVLPGSGPRELRLRVRQVPDGGRKCPVVFEDTARAGPPPVSEAGVGNRFGLAWGVVGAPPGEQRRLCPYFLASNLEQVNVARLRPDGRSLFLPVDPATWDPSRPLRVEVSLGLPLIHGVSRGAREISFLHYYDPPTSTGDSSRGRDYDAWLANLAARLTRELNGGRSGGDCGECDATAEPAEGGIVISPCDPVLTWDDNGTCCDPPYPGPGAQLKALPPPLWGATSFQNQLSTCDADTSMNPRLFAWCEFEKVIRTSAGTGLPRWESYVPLTNVLEGPNGLLDVKHPNQRSVAEKSVMYRTDSFYEIVEHGYNNPCRAAARAYYCIGGLSDWMPAFSSPQRVVKTFWLPDEKLPPSLDPSELYSYVDPNGVRQNLVGMHLAISTGATVSYWTWTTFFAPRIVGEQQAQDGTPLRWNDACTVGTGSDRPVEIDGVWESYFLCTDSAPGEHACGNPWGPLNECHSLSCDGCHRAVGAVPLPDKGSIPELAMAWLPTLTDYEIAQCFDDIAEANENGEELYKSFAPDACQ